MISPTLSFILWDVNPNVFPAFEIPKWYGLCWALGIFLGFRVMSYIYKKEGKSLEKLDILATYIIIGTLLGARFGHILFYDPTYYWLHPIEILPIRLSPHFKFTGLSGLASHGGGIGIFLSIYLYCRKYNEGYLWILDRISIIAALAGAFIRFGNLMNSEMIGIPTNLPWAFIFINLDPIPRHPAQLYESIFCVFLFVMMFSVWKVKGNKLHDGFLTGIFLILLFSFRFIDEYFKINQESFESHLVINMGQILSIPFILAGIILVQLNYFRNHIPKIHNT
ncbi:prolipoprotein diacylglyceryl transferase [Dyadobacter sp. 3J3]|uniref:prolipoprotein diacylglyceryl transferase n=1 Tax=Dyadobacter sp. 3J3 TaxID=2606600 RepID=UPI001356BF05|nr:prolipoprotein diacylglyceryl transferase [Dyadobacter sp. 3J3]